MSSKGKQMSVIIAGATGSTGRNLVSRLVSHPDVSRVVALARHPIPVNRWTSVFPHLHSGDALRYLSVVPVDWVKVLADSANIPSSYVCDGVWRQEEEEKERVHFLNLMTHSASITPTGAGATSRLGGNGRGILLGGSGPLGGGGSLKSGAGAGGQGSTPGPWASVSTIESAVGIRPVGYVKFVPRANLSARRENLDISRSMNNSTAGSSNHFSDAEKLQDSQAFLQQLLHNSFYNSVFSGHTVAINCLGTSHMFSTGSVLLVDYELSIAFAKMMRLFNCMAHAEPTEDEERLLVEATSRELDSVLWGEIYSACYGKKPEAAASSARASLPDQAFKESFPLGVGKGSNDDQLDGHTSLSPSSSPWEREEDHKKDMQRMHRGNMATLQHYSQVSVRGANASSPIPYLRAHGLRDRDLLKVFNRRTRTFASPGILHSLFLATPTTHTVTVDGAEQAAADAAIPPHLPSEGFTTTAGSVRIGASPMRVMKERARRKKARSAATATHRAISEDHSSILPQMWYMLRLFWGGASKVAHNTEAIHHHRYDMDTPHKDNAASDPDSVARRRAQLLLRRDVVKIWENASITIWRPGVFTRPKPRLSEWLFSFIERPVDVRIFAECIVDDIMESAYKERGFGSFGSVKVINGKSVSRRTTMKAIEDGLDMKDTAQRKYK